MAKQLSKTGITKNSTIEAWHVTQSIDALTGTDDYDITISGSLDIDNSPIANLTASGNISSSGTISMLTASIGGGIFTSASLAAGGGGGGSTFPYTGDAEITGSLVISGSDVELSVTGGVGVLLENNMGDKFEIKSRYNDGESPIHEQPIFSVLNPGVNSTLIVLGQTGSGVQTSFYNNIQTLNLWPEWSDGALTFGTNDQDGGSFDSASIQFGNYAPTSPTGLGVDLGTNIKRLRNVYAFNFTGSRIDVASITGSFSGDGSQLTGLASASYATTASYVLNAISASYAISASHEIIKEVSSSYSDTASFAQSGDGIFSGSFSGSFSGDGSQLTFPGLPTSEPTTTGSLWISGSSPNHPNSGYLMIFNP